MTTVNDPGRFGRVFENIQGFVSRGDIGGAALAVAHRGEQVIEWSFGEARQGVAASRSTLWPLASISKVYTAAMIMVLVERGELSLGTTVSSILPGFTGGGRE